jgi:hypothetical protein
LNPPAIIDGAMAKLNLSLACWDYDRTRPLKEDAARADLGLGDLLERQGDPVESYRAI